MKAPFLYSEISDLPNNVETLQNYIILLYGVVGSLTLDNAILRQQLRESEEALLNVQNAAQTSRL
ncbi:MAG: hypothetical protein U0X91_30825 [Spirosomataceae bacterium]